MYYFDIRKTHFRFNEVRYSADYENYFRLVTYYSRNGWSEEKKYSFSTLRSAYACWKSNIKHELSYNLVPTMAISYIVDTRTGEVLCYWDKTCGIEVF